jgi:transcriptional regulator with XRE-family HTH domain
MWVLWFLLNFKGRTLTAVPIGERIKLIRGEVSQKEFANSLGVAQNTLGNYERGERRPSVEFLAALVAFSDVNYHWLITGEGQMYREGKKTPECELCSPEDYEVVETLGDRIRFIWILSGLKRDELAKELDVTSATLTNYVKNKRSPTSVFLERICIRFGVSPTWLLLLRGPLFLDYNPEYPQLSPPPPEDTSAEKPQQAGEAKDDPQLSRELLAENRELHAENRQLWKENGDLRVELERAKARAAPDNATPEDAQNCA